MGTWETGCLRAGFFCVMSFICAGPVLGAGETKPTSGAESPPPLALFEQESDDGKLPKGQSVEIGSFGEIDLHVKDLDLTKVLQLLSMQSRRNIIASRNVVGTVSADLYDVDFYEALNAILATNGFGFQERGNFIYVYTTDELKALEEAARERVSEIVQLDYLSAADASAFVSPLLSNVGSIAVSGEVGSGFQPSLSDDGADSFALEATLVIYDYPENVERILATIEHLDVKPKQVLIEAMILSANLDEKNEFGVDFSLFFDVEIGDFLNPLNAVNELISGAATTLSSGSAAHSTVGGTSQAGGFKIGIFGDEFSIFVRALDQITDTTVLASPKLLVLNRQRADLLVGQRLGYLSSTSTDTSTTQTVEFLDVGTQLTVRPFVSSDDHIRMELRPSVSDGSTSVEAGTIIPNENTSELVTNVIVKSGQTVVLGGFFKEQDKKTHRQTPGVGDIPILGYAFRGHEDGVLRDEVIFMVKPTIMRDEMLTDMGKEAMEKSQLSLHGARQGLLPWGHHRLTTGAVRKAMQSIRDGDPDKALWHVNIALGLDPTNIDALQLKEQLTGQKVYIYTGRIMRELVASEAAEAGTPDIGVRDFGLEPFNDTKNAGTAQTVNQSVPTGWNNIRKVTDWMETEQSDVSDSAVESVSVSDQPRVSGKNNFSWFEEGGSKETDRKEQAADFVWVETSESEAPSEVQAMSIFDFVRQETTINQSAGAVTEAPVK